MGICRTDSLRSYESISAESEIEFLKVELENEKSYRDNASLRNKETEKALVKLQEQLRRDDYEWDYDEEFKVILKKNKELVDEIQDLKAQLPELKDKLKNAKQCGKECRMKHDSLNINLDLLNEVELLKTTKRLERMKTDIRSALISKEWALDNESKIYQRLLEQKYHLQSQLYHSNVAKSKHSYIERWQNGAINKQKVLPPIKQK